MGFSNGVCQSVWVVEWDVNSIMGPEDASTGGEALEHVLPARRERRILDHLDGDRLFVSIAIRQFASIL